jgi:glutamine synthetase
MKNSISGPKSNDDDSTAPLKSDVYGYFDYTPLDMATLSVNKAVFYLQKLGIEVEKVHHEVAKGQYEINFRYGPAFETAVNFITYKLAVKTATMQNGLMASFMPKPIFGINGSGSHTHQSISDKNGRNLFFDPDDDYHLSKLARHFLAGQLKHAKEIVAVTNPIVNSYKRLTPGYEAPVYLCWARRNRSALIRVPEYYPGRENATRLEGRWPDPSMNPFLAFAVMLEAGLDGINKKLEPADAVEEDVYHFDDAKLKKFYIDTLPATLGEALKLFSESEIAKRALGDYIVQKLLEAGKAQWEPYRLQVHKWELNRYLAF